MKKKLKKEDFYTFVLALVLVCGGLSLTFNKERIYDFAADLLGVEVEEDIADEDSQPSSAE